MPAYSAYVLRARGAKQSIHGFTLIELLVVIAIIAVLSTIGFAVFSGVQKGARDAKRRSDIDAIAKALEVNRTATGYPNISSNWFSSGQVPYDPRATGPGAGPTGCGKGNSADHYENECWYCYANNVTYSSQTQAQNCNGLNGFVTDVNWGSNVTSWWICANLEAGNPSYYCTSNQQ